MQMSLILTDTVKTLSGKIIFTHLNQENYKMLFFRHIDWSVRGIYISLGGGASKDDIPLNRTNHVYLL